MEWSQLPNQFGKPNSASAAAQAQHVLRIANHNSASRKKSEFSHSQIFDYWSRQREKLLFSAPAGAAAAKDIQRRFGTVSLFPVTSDAAAAAQVCGKRCNCYVAGLPFTGVRKQPMDVSRRAHPAA
jgi:hypothetical protein